MKGNDEVTGLAAMRENNKNLMSLCMIPDL